MQIGIMARTFAGPTLGNILDAIADHGLYCVQFSFGCVGLPELPDSIDTELCDKIRTGMESRKITMSAMSGTFNMIDPDIEKRKKGLKRLGELASACNRLGTSVITLCTGTRDPVNMWRRHPENDSSEAWHDLSASMEEALKMAEDNKVFLAIEPEVSNVVDSAVKAIKLIDEMQSPYLKVVMDGANIFHKGELPRMREILDEAFDLLSGHIILAHAKDLDHDGEAGHIAAGKGLLDYSQYLSLLSKIGFDVPLILHGLGEAQVDECIAFLREKMR